MSTALSPDQQTVLQLIYDSFRDTGQWAVFLYLDRRLDRDKGLDLSDLLPTIPSEIVRSDRSGRAAFQPTDRVWLSIDGVACCERSERDVELFLVLLRWCADRYAEFLPTSTTAPEEPVIAAADFAAAQSPPVSSIELKRLGALLLGEALSVWSGANNTGSDEWQFTLRREIRRYRDVTDLDDFRARRAAALGAPSIPTKPDILQPEPPELTRHDFFICHASEDKDTVARPLYQELALRGYQVWLDEAELTLGDSLRVKIDQGLANCEFGIVILSLAFFAKRWTEYELNGLLARQMQGTKVILPVWHGVDQSAVARYSPSLADFLRGA